jgi:hypothetical protein
MDFFHRPVFQKTRRFGNWICFRPQMKVGEKDTYSVGPLRESNPVIQWLRLGSPTSLCLYKSLQLRSVTCSHSCTLKMEAIRSSETSVLIRATRCHLPEDDNHQFFLLRNVISWLQTFYERICMCASERTHTHIYHLIQELYPWFPPSLEVTHILSGWSGNKYT